MDLLINAGALRQYRHNDNSGFVFGYDKEITDRVIVDMQAELEVWKDLATVVFTRGELTPEYSEARKKTTFCKEYDGESLNDISRDIHEAFDERFNHVIAEIPVDKYGIQKGVFKVTIDWYSE